MRRLIPAVLMCVACGGPASSKRGPEPLARSAEAPIARREPTKPGTMQPRTAPEKRPEEELRDRCWGERYQYHVRDGVLEYQAIHRASHDCQIVEGQPRWKHEEEKEAERKRRADERQAALLEAQRQAEEQKQAAAEEWAEFERRSADPKFRSEVGYGDTRWGMTLAEVRSRDRGGKMDRGMYVVPKRIAHWKAQAAYVFHAGRLTSVTVVLPARVDIANAIDDFRRAKALLIEKYGQPSSDNGNDRYDAVTLMTQIGTGEVEIEAEWSWTEEEIAVVCSKSGLGARTLIVYASRELLPLVKRVLDGKRSQDLDNL